jgi:hypothetical protein
LYLPADSTYRQIPKAKLLSRNEQSAGAESFLILNAKAPGAIAHGQLCTLTHFAWIAALPAIAGANQTEEEIKRPWLLVLGASLDAFSFRPPPIFA